MFNILFALSLLAASALAVPKCPPPGSMFFLVPHETDCSKYFICSHGTPVLQRCPDGTHFNPTFMDCVWPYESNCRISQDGPQYGGSQDAGSQDGESQDSESQDSESQDVGSQDGGSQSGATWYHRCRSGALSRHRECTKYYICVHGARVAMDCPSGLQWSSKLKQCAWPHESDCGVQDGGSQDAGSQDGGSQDVGSQYDGSQDDGSQDGGSQAGATWYHRCRSGALSRHRECTKYYICVHGARVAMDCPSGLQWSSRLKQCAWPRESDCGVQDGRPCKDGTLSANKDCRKYNICNHGAFLAMNCPTGLHWNSRLSFCDWPASARCEK